MGGIIKIVRGLHSKYQTRDPRIIIESLGFNIVDKPFKDCYGTMIRYKETIVISASTLQPPHIRRYVYGHELGHALLHKGLDLCFLKQHRLIPLNKIERQADAFCALLLLPDELLREYRNCSLEYAAANLEVPVKLLEYRLQLHSKL